MIQFLRLADVIELRYKFGALLHASRYMPLYKYIVIVNLNTDQNRRFLLAILVKTYVSYSLCNVKKIIVSLLHLVIYHTNFYGFYG